MRARSSHRNGYRAFQLIELIVVIAIVAVLAAVLMTAMKSVSNSRDNVRCVANLRQLGAGSLSYFAERNGQLLPGVFWYRNEAAGGIAEYLDLPAPYNGPKTYRDTILTCPAFKKRYPTLYPSDFNRCFSVNTYAHMYEPTGQQSGQSLTPFFPGNLNRIRNRSSMFMFADGAPSVEGRFVFTYLTPSHFNYLSTPHGGRINAVFFDGHIDQIAATNIKLPATNDFWGGSQ